MRSVRWTMTLALLVAVGQCMPARAQVSQNISQFSSNTSGMFGNQTRSSSFNQTFGTGATGGTGTTRGTVGTAGGGASAIGDLGGRELDMRSVGRTLFDANRFQVGTRQVGQFVGTDMQDPAKFVGASTVGREAATNTVRAGVNRNLRTGPANTRLETEIRSSARLAFPHAPPTPADVTESLQSLLTRASRIQSRSGVRVSVEGQTAILRGVVASPYDRLFAERLVRLEAGIWKVKNELVVAQLPAEPSAPAGPAAAEPTPYDSSRPPAPPAD